MGGREEEEEEEEKEEEEKRREERVSIETSMAEYTKRAKKKLVRRC